MNVRKFFSNLYLYKRYASGRIVKKKMAMEEAKKIPATPKKCPIITAREIFKSAVISGKNFIFFIKPRVDLNAKVTY